MAGRLAEAIVAMRREETLSIIRQRLDAGVDPLALLQECRQGMTAVGERFQAGDYFLAELLLSADVFKEAVKLLEPRLAPSAAGERRESVVLATMRGDIHDLGKNIFATLLHAHGFAVHDVGVDVAPDRLVATVAEVRPAFVGFSALITTAFAGMKEAAELLARDGLRDGVRLMVGGGVTGPAVKRYVGADFQSVDAMEGVTYCLANSGPGNL